MAATSQIQIYNFENNFEQAVQSILEAGGYHDSYIQGASGELPASRFEITAALGDALNEAVLLNGDHVYDFYSLRLSLRIVTIRPDTQPSLLAGVSSLHEEWCAAVRVLLQERRSPFRPAGVEPAASVLPYYDVKTIRPLPTVRDLDPRWMEDFSRLEFHIEFGIRPDAWP